jgi:transcriptional regulator with XRE-family HTH domain
MVYNLKYNWKRIGSRIKAERLKLDLDKGRSQQAFLARVGFSSNSRALLSKWENGETVPDLDTLLKMCDIFNCEVGYLLCEYDTKTREATDIEAVTGLTEMNIQKLKDFNNNIHGVTKHHMKVINSFIENDRFENFIHWCWETIRIGISGKSIRLPGMPIQIQTQDWPGYELVHESVLDPIYRGNATEALNAIIDYSVIEGGTLNHAKEE